MVDVHETESVPRRPAELGLQPRRPVAMRDDFLVAIGQTTPNLDDVRTYATIERADLCGMLLGAGADRNDGVHRAPPFRIGWSTVSSQNQKGMTEPAR